MSDQELIYAFEKSIVEAKQAIGTLANRHANVNSGIINYWEEKINPILNDLEVLKAGYKS